MQATKASLGNRYHLFINIMHISYKGLLITAKWVVKIIKVFSTITRVELLCLAQGAHYAWPPPCSEGNAALGKYYVIFL